MNCYVSTQTVLKFKIHLNGNIFQFASSYKIRFEKIVFVSVFSTTVNISFVFTHTPMCVSTVYTQYFPPSPVKDIICMLLGWDR